jgi:hypothetical protein
MMYKRIRGISAGMSSESSAEDGRSRVVQEEQSEKWQEVNPGQELLRRSI